MAWPHAVEILKPIGGSLMLHAEGRQRIMADRRANRLSGVPLAATWISGL
jgi:hypothetical protein